jgi:type VI secretion system protein ImpE
MTDSAKGQAEELLRAGNLSEALKLLQDQVRHDPANAKSRVFLFQLLSVLGQWDRAMTQLNVAAEMDPINLLMAQMCRQALNCEALRAEIFAGKRSPLIFGEPSEWVGLVIQANQMAGQGQYQQSQEPRERAFEAAPAVSGKIDDTPFEWLADADPRTGPIFEVILNGSYYWVPMCNIHEVHIDEPADLRDLVWIPAQFTWTNGGEAVGLIPTRYPGSEASDDPQIRLAKKTDWVEHDGGLFLGLGQRMLATDAGEYPLLEARQITFNNAVEAPPVDAPPTPREGDDG